MGIFDKIKGFITNDEQRWMKLTELCPHCDDYFEKKDIKKHIKECGRNENET